MFFSVKDQLARLAELEAKEKRKRDSDRVYSVKYVPFVKKDFKGTYSFLLLLLCTAGNLVHNLKIEKSFIRTLN